MKSCFKITILSSCIALLSVSCNEGAEMDIDATEPSEVREMPATDRGEIESAPIESAPTDNAANQGEVALNPPHGQPGHVCEIPVGAPLNGDPSSNTAPAQNNIQLQTEQPQNINTTQSGNSGEKPKINPPHGEPGHDCAVAVGAPL